MIHFRHGVASGDPTPSAVVLWTRVTPTAAATPGSGAGPTVSVTWQVATDAGFRRIAKQGTFRTGPGRDHTVKVDVTGLRAATAYYYRFSYDKQRSRVGRTRTAPATSSSPSQLRFGVVSCANWQAGWFSAYRHLAARSDLHAVIHLGDYLYEYAPGQYGMGPDDTDVRKHAPAKEIVSLRDYRQRHAQYKTDADLQALHAKVPFICTWDDHEVANDAHRDGAENHQPGEGSWAARSYNAHRAYDEWMPVRISGNAALGSTSASSAPGSSTERFTIYRRLRFGNLAELSMLDLRQYRDLQLGLGDPEVSDPARTITGRAQLDWLKSGLTPDAPQWRLVGNPVMIAPITIGSLPHDLVDPVNQLLGVLPRDGEPYNVDQWDGYTDDRREVLEHIADQGVRDVVFLTGDIHSGWACELPYDPGSYPLVPGTGGSAGVEFVCSSVTSNNLKDITGDSSGVTTRAVVTGIQTANRHVKYLDFDRHGYSVLTLTPSKAQMDWFVIGDRADKATGVTHAVSYLTRPGTGRLSQVSTPASGPAVIA